MGIHVENRNSASGVRQDVVCSGLSDDRFCGFQAVSAGQDGVYAYDDILYGKTPLYEGLDGFQLVFWREYTGFDSGSAKSCDRCMENDGKVILV